MHKECFNIRHITSMTSNIPMIHLNSHTDENFSLLKHPNESTQQILVTSALSPNIYLVAGINFSTKWNAANAQPVLDTSRPCLENSARMPRVSATH